MKHYDAIVIGFGKGGKTLTGAMAKMGMSAAIIEKSEMMYGGTCINVGCIPSKSLVTSAAESALNPGAPFAEKAERYAAAIGEKRRVTGLLRGKNYSKLADLPGVDVILGQAAFLSPNSVSVKTSGGVLELEADKIFINTGAEPIIKDIPGLAGNPKVYTSEALMDEEKLPERLTLIGAGYIGMEFASMYTNFGSKVTVLQDGDRFLPKEDEDIAAAIHDIMEKRGVRFVTGAKIKALEGGTVVYEKDGAEERLEGDAILLATGRKANTASLNCEAAGVALTPRGAVQVDEYLRTTAPNIWAMGDVAGGLQFTYVSLDDYRVVLSQLSGKGGRTTKNRGVVPYSVFMDTPLSRAGITERDAAEKGLPYRVLKMPAAAVPKAQVLRKTDGVLKAVVNTETGKILGVSLLCAESYEMINTVKLAMDMGADYTVLRDQIFTHPTMSEALNDLFAL
jgi:pyruvate/2-oxoglutarate dehydrogenase complex dihydrolipoamide dehydrogenase (E3) component